MTKRTALKILVIGATGAGKSSLINLFYVWGMNFDPRRIADLK
jgi:predicted GTPase